MGWLWNSIVIYYLLVSTLSIELSNICACKLVIVWRDMHVSWNMHAWNEVNEPCGVKNWLFIQLRNKSGSCPLPTWMKHVKSTHFLWVYKWLFIWKYLNFKIQSNNKTKKGLNLLVYLWVYHIEIKKSYRFFLMKILN